jgi:peptide/nickel transport system ATP-binding protein
MWTSSAIPSPDPDAPRNREILTGDIPSPSNPPSGCVFRTRCPYAIDACAQGVPKLREVAPGHFKACIRDDISWMRASESTQSEASP